MADEDLLVILSSSGNHGGHDGSSDTAADVAGLKRRSLLRGLHRSNRIGDYADQEKLAVRTQTANQFGHCLGVPWTGVLANKCEKARVDLQGATNA